MDMHDNKGQFSLGAIITVVIGVVLILVVGVNVTQDFVTDANLQGADATIADLYTTLFVIGGLLLIAGLFRLA